VDVKVWSNGDRPEYTWIPDPLWGEENLPFYAKQKQQVKDGRSKRIYVYPQGLYYIDGDTEAAGTWAAVSHLITHSTTVFVGRDYATTQHTLDVYLSNGKHMSSGMETDKTVMLPPGSPGVPEDAESVRLPELGQLIAQRVVKEQVPAALTRLQSGNNVVFGPVTVTPEGITGGGKSLPWNGLQMVGSKKGKFVVVVNDDQITWKSVQTKKVPRMFVLKALVATIAKGFGTPPARPSTLWQI
jgi:hypothetical protein